MISSGVLSSIDILLTIPQVWFSLLNTYQVAIHLHLHYQGNQKPWTWNTSTVSSILKTFTGYYLYIETSSPRSKGHKAWLVSPPFKSTNGRCLQFWYHMYGSTIGTLNVLLLQNKTRSSPIWSLSSNQGDIWRVAQVTLNSAVDFSVSASTCCYRR